MRFDIIVPYTPGSPEWTLSLRFFLQNFYAFLIFSAWNLGSYISSSLTYSDGIVVVAVVIIIIEHVTCYSSPKKIIPSAQ
jgi:hypothetical protein